ncbi:MAG TPA: 50S ribosomal protein L21 [Candidatus Dormibacteraeota bacterium]|nr:50S ribosomal protein L21 [Candidatus Dormibacteraeota bacterium]
MYAVIQTGGKQYRVAPGDTIRIERVSGEVGEKVTFGSVLAVHTDEKKVILGANASKATVTGKIVEQGRAKKVTVLKFKKTNQYKISRGHRQNYTAVKVSDISL